MIPSCLINTTPLDISWIFIVEAATTPPDLFSLSRYVIYVRRTGSAGGGSRRAINHNDSALVRCY